MQWRTFIVNPENWVLASSTIKDPMLWAIADMPWLCIRTHEGIDGKEFPFQLKSQSWTKVSLNEQAVASEEVVEISDLLKKRLVLLQELYYRSEIACQNQGIGNANSNLFDFYQYLVSKKILEGTCADDSTLMFENTMQILKHLDGIKKTVIKECLSCRNDDDFLRARKNMERLFFTNILL